MRRQKGGRLREEERVRAIVESRARSFAGRRLAHEAARVGHAIEPVIVKDDELAVAQQLHVDLGSDDRLTRALLDRERRILGIRSAPEAAVDLELDDAIIKVKEGIRMRRDAHLRAGPSTQDS